jgi:hypothetical protein
VQDVGVFKTLFIARKSKIGHYFLRLVLFTGDAFFTFLVFVRRLAFETTFLERDFTFDRFAGLFLVKRFLAGLFLTARFFVELFLDALARVAFLRLVIFDFFLVTLRGFTFTDFTAFFVDTVFFAALARRVARGDL